MKRFKYKLNGLTIAIIIIGFVFCLTAIVFSILKLIANEGISDATVTLNVIAIVLAVLCSAVFVFICTMHYRVDAGGIKLVFGFFEIKSNSFTPDKIAAVVYKTKDNVLLVVSDLTPENPPGTLINIDSSLFNAFVKTLTDSGISFDYIEDIN